MPKLWQGPIGFEGVATGDNRYIAAGSLRWDTLPVPLRYAAEDVGAHDGAQVAGHINTLERRDTSDPDVKIIWATGDFDDEGQVGTEAARHVAASLTNGISMDLDDVSFEVRVGQKTVVENGQEMASGDPEEIMVTTNARIRAATIVAIPAFEGARIQMSVTPDEEAATLAARVAATRAKNPTIKTHDNVLATGHGAGGSFAYDPAQWRDPANGQWIDMPTTLLKKVKDVLEDLPHGVLNDKGGNGRSLGDVQNDFESATNDFNAAMGRGDTQGMIAAAGRIKDLGSEGMAKSESVPRAQEAFKDVQTAGNDLDDANTILDLAQDAENGGKGLGGGLGSDDLGKGFGGDLGKDETPKIGSGFDGGNRSGIAPSEATDHQLTDRDEALSHLAKSGSPLYGPSAHAEHQAVSSELDNRGYIRTTALPTGPNSDEDQGQALEPLGTQAPLNRDDLGTHSDEDLSDRFEALHALAKSGSPEYDAQANADHRAIQTELRNRGYGIVRSAPVKPNTTGNTASAPATKVGPDLSGSSDGDLLKEARGIKMRGGSQSRLDAIEAELSKRGLGTEGSAGLMPSDIDRAAEMAPLRTAHPDDVPKTIDEFHKQVAQGVHPQTAIRNAGRTVNDNRKAQTKSEMTTSGEKNLSSEELTDLAKKITNSGFNGDAGASIALKKNPNDWTESDLDAVNGYANELTNIDATEKDSLGYQTHTKPMVDSIMPDLRNAMTQMRKKISGGEPTGEDSATPGGDLSDSDRKALQTKVRNLGFNGLVEFKRKNWVDEVGGLPDYIRFLANHIKAGHPDLDQSRAIAIAVGVAKRWARKGTVTGRPGAPRVGAATVAKAAAAVAEWEAKKAASHVTKAGKTNTFGLDQHDLTSIFMVGNIAAAKALGWSNSGDGCPANTCFTDDAGWKITLVPATGEAGPSFAVFDDQGTLRGYEDSFPEAAASAAEKETGQSLAVPAAGAVMPVSSIASPDSPDSPDSVGSPDSPDSPYSPGTPGSPSSAPEAPGVGLIEILGPDDLIGGGDDDDERWARKLLGSEFASARQPFAGVKVPKDLVVVFDENGNIRGVVSASEISSVDAGGNASSNSGASSQTPDSGAPADSGAPVAAPLMPAAAPVAVDANGNPILAPSMAATHNALAAFAKAAATAAPDAPKQMVPVYDKEGNLVGIVDAANVQPLQAAVPAGLAAPAAAAAAASTQALAEQPGGGFPITDVPSLKNAIKSIGRSKDPAKTKAHIKSQAKRLKHPELIPDSWSENVDVLEPTDLNEDLSAENYEPEQRSLVASGAATLAAPIAPPKVWFEDPVLSGPTPIQVTEDGRVYGHLATWDVCHLAMPNGVNECVTAPKSKSGYSLFHLGYVTTDEGTNVPVGRITMNTTHAGDTWNPRRAIAHYENTGLAIADVHAGEDQYGIWVAGALRPDATPAQIRALKASPLSGDWRNVSRNGRDDMELTMALAVNQPGFPVRPKGLVASGKLQTLFAAGVVPPAKVRAPGKPGALSLDDVRYLQLAAQRERDEQVAEMAAKAKAAIMDTKIQKLAAERAAAKRKAAF